MIKNKDDNVGGKLTDLPNEKYKKFFDKFEEINFLEIEKWGPAHLLGYFCKKYYDTYNVKYQFKFNNPSPTKSFEVFQIKKLASMLSANPKILKEYIEWIYENKVIKAKRRLTSISFMTVEGVVNDYKINVLLKGKKNLNVDRSTPLPDKYKIIFQQAGVTITNYGELAFLSQMSDMPEALNEAFRKAEQEGFDKEVLERIV
jgi:hypothetical protein